MVFLCHTTIFPSNGTPGLIPETRQGQQRQHRGRHAWHGEFHAQREGLEASARSPETNGGI